MLPLTNIKQKVNIIPQLKTASLLSVGKLVDDGCMAHFTKNCALRCRNKKLIIKRKRNIEDRLYNVQFTNKTNESNNNEMKNEIQNQKINIIIQIDKNKADLAKFLHGTLFSPAISTLKKAIANNHLLTWPGIEKLNFTKLVVDSLPMSLGHLNQERKNLQSTKLIKKHK